jgi:hypothetical protein
MPPTGIQNFLVGGIYPDYSAGAAPPPPSKAVPALSRRRFHINAPGTIMPKLKQTLRNNWERYYVQGNPGDKAFVVAHGSFDDSYGFTQRPAPGMLFFYTFHTDPMYTVEIEQVINYQRRVRFDNEIVDCAVKSPTSIMGKGGSCWNYWLSAWDANETTNLVRLWAEAPTGDLLMLKPGKSTLFSSAPNSYLDDLFEALDAAQLTYDSIHFCACRSVKGMSKRVEPKSSRELYKSRTPYWP